MPDKVELRIGADNKNKIPGIKIKHFLSYQIDSDLYTPADAFHLELANPETAIKHGSLCEIFINDQKELTGIIDKVHRKVKKSGVSLAVEGRDYMGLLVDSHCEQFPDVRNFKLKTLANLLLAKVPFINRKEIVYQKNIVGKLKGKGKKKTTTTFLSDPTQQIGHIEVGQTIFEVLKMFALSRGLLFYCQPDGTLVFGRPMAKGEPEYTLQIDRAGKGNNVIESEVVDDISRRFSKVTVMGQQQGNQQQGNQQQGNQQQGNQQQGNQRTFLAAGINTPSGIWIDTEFPFYKPFVCIDNNDSLSPKEHARLIMEKQRREGLKIIYAVGRHSQNGQNWTINKFCHVSDEVQGIDGDYLIYGRTFELNKKDGPTTKLKLGLPGLIA
jgi:prophage tail gpP-like protein